MKFSTKKGRRMDNAINAGSMADIAFLLLIFFLVTTVIIEDKGIVVRLPPWIDEPIDSRIPPKNILAIKVNATDQILVEGDYAQVDHLKDRAIEFVLNPQQREDLPNKPTKAVISLQNDRGTSYEAYLAVYNELKAAYNEMWEDAALRRYQQTYEELSPAIQRSIRSEIPLLISEAEPTNFLKASE